MWLMHILFLRYDEIANNIETHETISIIQFMMLDCSPFKNAVLSHCQEWQHKLSQLLKKMAIHSLTELHNYLVDNGDRYGNIYYLPLFSC
jgi:dynein heavy chain